MAQGSQDKCQSCQRILWDFGQREQDVSKSKIKVCYTAAVIATTVNLKEEEVAIRALLDTGTTQTLVLKEFLPKTRAHSAKERKLKGNTMGGTFTTKSRALIDFTFPEFSQSKKVTWICHVDDNMKSTNTTYDMIIGMDLMTAIGITVDTQSRTIKWEGSEIPLKTRGTLDDPEQCQRLYEHLSPTTTLLSEAEECQSRILEADYSSVDISEHINTLNLS